MKKVLIIEDEAEKYSLMKGAFEAYSDYFEVFPKLKNSRDSTFNNWGQLMESVRNKNFEIIFQSEFLKDIDLFVVDLTLQHQNSEDRIGVDLLNYLHETNYRKGEFKYLICTRWIPDHIGDLKLGFDQETQYVSKVEYARKNKFVEKVVEKACVLLNINGVLILKNSGSGKGGKKPGEKSSFLDSDWWDELTRNIENHLLNRLVLLMFYVLIISTSIFSLLGICVKTFDVLEIIFSHKQDDATNFLKYVEDMFLFILPLIIVFSFVSYYKSTIGIRLTGGDARDIDNAGAMKSINNSKLILLSSLTSFTIIKIIDKLFVETGPKPTITELCSYGIFIVILMTFILLQHKKEKVQN